MTQRAVRIESLPTEVILSSCIKKILSSGDIYLESQSCPDTTYFKDEAPIFQLVTSPKMEYLTRSPNALRSLLKPPHPPQSFRTMLSYLIDRAGTRGYVSRVTANIDGHPKNFAIKRMFPHMLDLTGIDQFMGMRALQQAGVICPEQYAASTYMLLSAWVHGKKTNEEDPTFKRYLLTLIDVVKELQCKGIIPSQWTVDASSINYRVNDPDSSNILEKFTVLDPFFIQNLDSYDEWYY